MRTIIKYLKPYTRKMLLAALLITASTLCDLMLPTLMSGILNTGIPQGDQAVILRACLQMLLLAGVSLGCVIWGSKISSKVVAAFCADVRADVFRKVNTLSFDAFGKLGTAALVTRATHDVETLSWVASMLSGTVATIPILFLGGVLLALRKDVVLSLVMLAFIPFILLAVILIGRKVVPLWINSDKYIDRQNAILRERLRGIRVIRAFLAEPREHKRLADATNIMADNIIRGNTSMGIIEPLSMLLLNLAVLVIVYLGGWRMVHRVSAVSAGDIYVIIQYVTLAINGVLMGSFAIVMLPHAQVAAGRINEVLGATGVDDDTGGREAALTGGIELDDVSFSYGGSENAVDHVSLRILPGQRVSVIGGTGSGKSTLISLLLGFRAPTGGTIRFDGIPAEQLSRRCLRSSISCVLQGASVYSGTIGENIRMGNAEADEADVWQAVDIAQLRGFIDECPGGLDYEVKQAGKNLSGGQKQRLSIARALVRKTPIYIFDDSFSALDFLTEKKLRAALNEKIQGRTQLVVTQRITSAMSADCIYVMDRGRLVGAGTHDELLAHCGIYQEIYASQTGGGAK